MDNLLLMVGGYAILAIASVINVLVGGAVLKYATYLEDVEDVSYLKAIIASLTLTFVPPILIIVLAWIVALVMPLLSLLVVIFAWPLIAIIVVKLFFEIKSWPAFKILVMYYGIFFAISWILGAVLA